MHRCIADVAWCHVVWDDMTRGCGLVLSKALAFLPQMLVWMAVLG